MGTVFKLKKEGFEFPPDKKIIKSDEYMHYLEAESIIEEARKEAHKIIESARQAYEAEKSKGFQEGLLEGKQNMAMQMMDTVARTVNYFESIEEKVTDIVIASLKKIVGEMDDRVLIQRVVRKALSVARNQKQVTLRVSPQQVDLVREKIREITADFPTIGIIDIEADPRLEKGGCIMESDIGVVDATVEVQIAALRSSMMKSFKRAAK